MENKEHKRFGIVIQKNMKSEEGKIKGKNYEVRIEQN